MNKQLAEQYTGFMGAFLKDHPKFNADSRRYFYSKVDKCLSRGLKVLDVGCGDGEDIIHYSLSEANVVGIDANAHFVEMARKKGLDARCAYMENLPFPDEFFDVVLSKWAMQTSEDVPGVIREMHRVLRPSGQMAYLTVHPIRQFLEKKKHPKDYFKQEIVHSCFFDGTVTADEPSHTIKEYLNPFFYEHFRQTGYGEEADFPSCEHIDGDTYPCYMFVKAVKIK